MPSNSSGHRSNHVQLLISTSFPVMLTTRAD